MDYKDYYFNWFSDIEAKITRRDNFSPETEEEWERYRRIEKEIESNLDEVLPPYWEYTADSSGIIRVTLFYNDGRKIDGNKVRVEIEENRLTVDGVRYDYNFSSLFNELGYRLEG